MRHWISRFRWTCLALVVAGGLCQPSFAQPVLPDFGSAVFDDPLTINNTYYPLVPGTVSTFVAEYLDEDGEMAVERIEVIVTHDVRVVSGVPSRVVRDRVWDGDQLDEDTFDWYAQDSGGNVWYVGEFSTEFEYDDDDHLIGTSNAGSWETGVDGALPGYIMKASPQVGDAYFQEYYIGEAEDEAIVTVTDGQINTPVGAFQNVVTTLEFSALDPGVMSNKLYAPGRGLVAEEEHLDEFGVPEFIVELRGEGSNEDFGQFENKRKVKLEETLDAYNTKLYSFSLAEDSKLQLKYKSKQGGSIELLDALGVEILGSSKKKIKEELPAGDYLLLVRSDEEDADLKLQLKAKTMKGGLAPAAFAALDVQLVEALTAESAAGLASFQTAPVSVGALVSATPIPEPATVCLLAMGVLAVATRRSRAAT